MHGAGREYGAQLLIGSWFRVAKCCRQTALFSCCRLQAVRSWPVGCLATAAHTAYPLTAWNIRTSSGCGPLVGPRENAIAAQEFYKTKNRNIIRKITAGGADNRSPFRQDNRKQGPCNR